MKINVAALQSVKQHILEEPQRFFMEGWGKVNGKLYGIDSDHFPSDVNPPCNTAACIGGWLIILDNKNNNRELNHNLCLARRSGALILLGEKFDENDPLQSLPTLVDALFCSECWDEPYRSKYIQLKNMEPGVSRRTAIAQLAAEYIDYFCEKYNEE